MDNVFRDTLDNLEDVKSNLPDLESVVTNLSEVVWAIDLTEEPYQITYHNDPKEKNALSTIFGTFPRTIEELQQRIHELILGKIGES